MTKKVFQRACQNPACRVMIVVDINQDEVVCPHCNTKHHVRWIPKFEKHHRGTTLEWSTG